ncbi:hypothetical protein CPC08DRAFT_518552 [Agrocybe pediades]|nr:hypothetical protein CPC08DRAFT_518552 [Agrocybe pediades]
MPISVQLLSPDKLPLHSVHPFLSITCRCLCGRAIKQNEGSLISIKNESSEMTRDSTNLPYQSCPCKMHVDGSFCCGADANYCKLTKGPCQRTIKANLSI